MLKHRILKEISKFFNIDFLTVEAEYHSNGESIDRLIEYLGTKDIVQYRATRCALAINDGFNVETDKDVIDVFIAKKFFTTIIGENFNELISKSKNINNCVVICNNVIYMKGNLKVVKI